MILDVLMINENPNICGTGGLRVNNIVLLNKLKTLLIIYIKMLTMNYIYEKKASLILHDRLPLTVPTLKE